MEDDKRKAQIKRIIEEDLPDTIGIKPEEYLEAGTHYRWKMGLVIYKDSPCFPLMINCWEKAALSGSVTAMRMLGAIYNTVKDPDKSYQWYLEGALGGDVTCIYQIAMMYHYGRYVHQDYKKAYDYFMQAFKHFYLDSAYYLGLYAEWGVAEPADMEGAIRYYKLGALMRDAKCVKRLKELGLPDETEREEVFEEFKGFWECTAGTVYF